MHLVRISLALLVLLSGQCFAGLFDKPANPLASSSGNEPLPVEQAFVFTTNPSSPGVLDLTWAVQPDYYLYRDKIHVSVDTDKVKTEVDIPELGDLKQDPLFGDVQVFHQSADAHVRYWSPQGLTSAILTVSYQGCWEGGICFPPQQRTIQLSGIPQEKPGLTAGNAAASAAKTEAAQGKGVTPPPENIDAWLSAGQGAFFSLLNGQSLWFVLGVFFIAGLGLSLTPCVFPMIPILSSMIAGQKGAMTGRRGFVLSLVYVLAMSMTYTLAGVFAGLAGANIQAQLQSPWVLGSMAVFFVLFALAMFDVITIQMPSALQSRLNDLSGRGQKRGGYLGITLMGILSALIVGPCVAAPLAGALLFIGQQGSPVVGGVALFAMSLGMGGPLLIAGSSAGHFLPRAGQWMNTVKKVFGVLMLLMALWLLERFIPWVWVLLLLSALCVVTAVVMGALDTAVSSGQRFVKGLACLLLIYGLSLALGVAGGGRSLLTPLDVYTGGVSSKTEQPGLKFERVTGWDELQQALSAAHAEGKPVMLDFYADWCISCKELEFGTFKDPQVIQALSSYKLIQVDVTANTADHKRMYDFYQLVGPPAMIFYSKDGEYLQDKSWSGVLNAEQFLGHLPVY
ncbi:protein-disulfide reductase DsbD [Pokkaliibacter sp. CJK22405]|uniref:protein-disulfide reductase DsbD n=1 Tax=Pokkaliibacter sp. CJK22405 TaxID=3384615 RepID=UPI0039849179